MEKTAAAPAPDTAPKVTTSGKKRGRPIGTRKDKTARPVNRDSLRHGEALGRDGEIITRHRTLGDGAMVSEFDVPEHLRDPNWEVQAVRTSVFGKPDPQAMNEALRDGFKPCRRADYPGMLPDLGPNAKTLERDGLMLMERPRKLANEALADHVQAAVNLRRDQGEAFGERKLAKGFEKGRQSGDGRFNAGKQIKRGKPEVAVGNAYAPERQYAGPGDDE
jgi:hypothetical protein